MCTREGETAAAEFVRRAARPSGSFLLCFSCAACLKFVAMEGIAISMETTSTYRIQGATGEWEVVIGLEVHAQVTSQAKLFSGAATAFGAEPNTQERLSDARMPGSLPGPHGECTRPGGRPHMPRGAGSH